MKKNRASKNIPKKVKEADVPSFDLGVLSPHSPKKHEKSAHANEEKKHRLSPRQARAEARTKQKHDFDAGESSRQINSAKRKGKVIDFDDDFVEDEAVIKPAKKVKVSPTVKAPKKAPTVKSPKNVQQHSLVKVRI